MKSLETIENNETTLPISEAKRKRQKGVTTVEYAIMLVLIAIVVATSNPGIASAIKSVFTNMTTALTTTGG